MQTKRVFGRKPGDIYAVQRLRDFEALQEKRLKKAEAASGRAIEGFGKKSEAGLERELSLESERLSSALEQARAEAEREAKAVVAEYAAEGKRLQGLFEKNRGKALAAAEKALLEM